MGESGGFPGDPVAKNPIKYAGDAYLIPGPGTKIPHAVEQLSCQPQLESLCATAKDFA